MSDDLALPAFLDRRHEVKGVAAVIGRWNTPHIEAVRGQRRCHHVLCQRPIVGRSEKALYCNQNCKRNAKDYRAVRRRGLQPLRRRNKRMRDCVICGASYITWAAGNPRLTCSDACKWQRLGLMHPPKPRLRLSPEEREARDARERAKRRAAYHAQSPEEKQRAADERRIYMANPARRARRDAWNKADKARKREQAWLYRRLTQRCDGPIHRTMYDDARRYRLLMKEDDSWQRRQSL